MSRTPDNTSEKICLIVLGPPRSGTSSLAGLLAIIGASLPKNLMNATKENPLGYFESSEIMKFNDLLLAELGSDWKDISPLHPKTLPPQIIGRYHERAVKLLQQEFGESYLPTLKDPRVCRLVDFWRNAFIDCGYTPIFIHTHRDPLETTLSLQHRDHIPLELGQLIWLRYVLDAEKATRGEKRVFTNYQLILNNWRQQIQRIKEKTGLTFHRSTNSTNRKVGHFLDEKLRHQVKPVTDIFRDPQAANLVRETFEVLERWSSDRPELGDNNRLDILRNKLDGAADTIGCLVDGLTSLTHGFNLERQDLLNTIARLSEEKTIVNADLERISTQSRANEIAKNFRIEDLQRDNDQLNNENCKFHPEIDLLRNKYSETATEAQRIIELEKIIINIEASRLEFETESRASQINNAEKIAHLAAQVESLRKESEINSNQDSRLETNKANLEDEAEQIQASLQDSLRERDNRIRALEQEIKSRFEELAKLSSILLQTENQLHEESSRIKSQLIQLQSSLEIAESKYREEQERLNAVLSSTSWKVTSPVRKLLMLLRLKRGQI